MYNLHELYNAVMNFWKFLVEWKQVFMFLYCMSIQNSYVRIYIHFIGLYDVQLIKNFLMQKRNN